MENYVGLKKWEKQPQNKSVKLIYEDGDIVYISNADFNRAFGTIIRCSKEIVIRDYALGL
ncbi:MAG: hypothetical protein ACI4HZ_03815 [Ruminococcus sp.]